MNQPPAPGSSVLRPGILDGVGVALAGGGPPGLDAELERLGANVCELSADGALTALVFDGSPAFAEGGPEGLMRLLEHAWAAVDGVSARLIASEAPAKVLLLAPLANAGPHSGAARAALENVARTLSVEWARFQLTACAILPGLATTTAQLRELVAFLLSPAGEYFSGCALELGAVTSGTSSRDA
jgi:NAD(P)-dependent dehydrogenase (short-subunit alcohol dehydrogenase family)